MIGDEDFATVREINRKLPFAHPIEQGEVPRSRIFWAPAGEGYDLTAPKLADLAAWTEITHAVDMDFARYQSHVLGEWS